ncbi:MFS transporter [Paraglaciecola sp. L3A3]|uniref:MFS transporter n=1 Tax=Paraglaciecola sp. L3A3 TaxID=2686358 RepID=UPI00131B1E35|nr:MFS transporter [Paraglaciecola sp. L3A3]
MNSTELRTAFSLAFIYVLRMLGLFMIMPVLAISAQHYPDYSAFLVGLAIGGYGLTQAVLQIPMGVLSDKIGRKPVIAGGLLIFAVGSLVAANAESMQWVVIGRFLQGAGAIAGAIMALAGDLTREEQRPKVMAIIGISIGFSFYLALLLGPLVVGKYGLSGIFFATGTLALLCILLVVFVVPNGKNIAPRGDTLPIVRDLKILFSHPQLLRLNISVMLLHMLITLLFVQIPVFLIDLAWPLSTHWKAYSIVLFASIIGLVALMSLAKKQQKVVMLLSVAGLALVFAVMAIDHSSIVYLLIIISLFFTCFNYLEANFPAMVSSIAPAGKKGSAMGIYASFQFFGAFIGGLLSGSISQYVGNQWVFVLASGLCIIWLLLIQGISATNRLKRYTLKTINQTPDLALQQLSELEGVVDVTVVSDEQVIYLKADGKHFDMQQARRVLGLQE